MTVLFKTLLLPALVWGAYNGQAVSLRLAMARYISLWRLLTPCQAVASLSET